MLEFLVFAADRHLPRLRGIVLTLLQLRYIQKTIYIVLRISAGKLKRTKGVVEMGNLFIVVGLFYGVTLLIQALFYTQCARKAALGKEEGVGANGVVAGQGCH